MVKVAIAGCTGRMGLALMKNAIEHADIELVGGSVREKSEYLGSDLGTLAGLEPLNIKATHDLDEAFEQADVIVDFTLPKVMMRSLDFYQTHQKRVVIGTTGFDDAQLKALLAASKTLPMVHAPNMSIGVNLCFKLAEKAAQVLKGFDVDIMEAHHRNKVDAPSGTALAFGQKVANARGQKLEEVAVFNRHDPKYKVRQDQEIGFATMRGGDIFGEHTVQLAGPDERVEITHRAGSRGAFAKGALVAALWLNDQSQGLYDMQDVLGLTSL